MNTLAVREYVSEDGREANFYHDLPDGKTTHCFQVRLERAPWMELPEQMQSKIRGMAERHFLRSLAERECERAGHELDRYGWHCEYCGNVIDESKIPLR